MNRRAFIGLLLAAALLLGAVAPAQAARGRRGRGPTGTFHGTINAIASNTVRVNVGKEQEKIVIFWTDNGTSITGGGKVGTINDLEPGQIVTVKAVNGYARSIEVQVKGDDGEGKKKEKKKRPTTAP